MKKKGMLIVYGVILSGFALFFLQKPKAESPISIKITLLKTELLADKTAEPLVVIEDANGIEADLVNNPNSVFGEGEVPAGEYKRIKLTLKNRIIYSGPNPCGGNAIQDEKVLIDSQKSEDEAVELYFATADDGGDTGWVANGTADHPLFIQNPINVEADLSTVVKLIFNTANTLQCIGNSPVLIPPTISIVNYVEKPALSTCQFPAEYWFTHFNISTGIYDENGQRIDPTLQNLFGNTTVVSGWGMVTFGAPDQNGVGSWYIYPGKKAEDGGMAEHRHNLARYCTESQCEDGYHNPTQPDAGNQPFGGINTITGNKVVMSMGENSIEGYLSDDCSVFIGLNISSDSDNDTVFAVKKSQFSSLPKEKIAVLTQRVEIKYNDLTNKTDMFWTSLELTILDLTKTPLKTLSWMSMNHLDTEYDENGLLKNWKINEPGEKVDSFSAESFPFSISDNGILTGQGMDSFIALGANNNGIVAGANVEVNPTYENHVINSAFIMSFDESPSISDLNGKWMIVIRNSLVEPANDGWYTGDENAKYGIEYGMVEIENGRVKSKSFTYRDIFTGDMTSDVGSEETLELVSECYEEGKPLTTSPCNGISLNVFKIIGTDERTIGRIALDKTKKIILMWAPIDLDDTPKEEEEHKGGNQNQSFGVGIKVE